MDESEALKETAEILADPETMAAIEKGGAEAERGELVELVELDEIRDELHRARG